MFSTQAQSWRLRTTRSGYLPRWSNAAFRCRSSREAFLRRLEAYEREFDSRASALNEFDQVLALHAHAGFAVIRCVETDMGVSSAARHSVGRLAQQRYVLVAQPDPDRGVD